MAAAKSVEKLEKELFCAVCMQVLTSPKRLRSCDHTFCETCLKMIVENGTMVSTLKCPICRKVSPLPEQGVSGFESNQLVCRMIAVLKTKLGSDKKGCDSCGDTESPLMNYCRDCFQLICQSCSESHERMKLKFRNHRTVQLSDIQNGKVKVGLFEDSEKVKKYKCDKHDWEMKSYFCKSCNLRICRDCVTLEHSKDGHDCTTAQQVFTSMQEKIGRLRDRCQQRKKAIEWDMNAVDVKGRGIAVKKFQEMREGIGVATLAAESYLKEAEGELLAKVDKFERAFKRSLQLSRENISQMADNIDRLISEADSVMGASEAPEFSALPDDLIKKMEELLADEYIVAAKDELLALKGSSIQSHHLSLTMSAFADVCLSGVWQVKSTFKLSSKSSPLRVFCNSSHIILQTRGNIYRRHISGEGHHGPGWDEKLLTVRNNEKIAEMAVSFKDQVIYISFRDNVDLGIRMAPISDINSRNGVHSSYGNMKSVTPPCWSADTEMMTTDCKGRIIIVENQMENTHQTPPTSAIHKSSWQHKIPQETTGTACGNGFTGHSRSSGSASFLPSKTSLMPTSPTGTSTLGTGTQGLGLNSKLPAVRKKGLGANNKTPSLTTQAKEKTNFADVKCEASSLRSAKIYRHRHDSTNYGTLNPIDKYSRSDSFQVPFGVVGVAAAKTGQLAFLREDKKGVIVTDEDGRVLHEIKEVGRVYLSISCTESDSLYVLSASSGSHSVTVTKHSLEDGRLLEYIVDKLDTSDDVTANKRQIMANYGNDRIAMIVGKEILIFTRKEWTVIDDYDDYESDDSDL